MNLQQKRKTTEGKQERKQLPAEPVTAKWLHLDVRVC